MITVIDFQESYYVQANDKSGRWRTIGMGLNRAGAMESCRHNERKEYVLYRLVKKTEQSIICESWTSDGERAS